MELVKALVTPLFTMENNPQPEIEFWNTEQVCFKVNKEEELLLLLDLPGVEEEGPTQALL